MTRELLIQELERIDEVEWMHNTERNSDITIDLFDISNERWFNVFCRNKCSGMIFFYGQSAEYPGGDKWKLEDIETLVLEQIVKRLQFIENRGDRLPFPKPGHYHDRLNNWCLHSYWQ